MPVEAKQLTIELGPRSYSLWIGSGLLDQASHYLDALGQRPVLVVTNTTIAPLYLQTLLDQLPAASTQSLIVDDGEQHKTIASWQKILDALVAMGAQRDVCLIALGGGVIGDLVGFAAASYMRGVDFIQIPTTLLAQVDASVGGKTGVNHARGKNLIGAFHQPRAVIIDTRTLDSLPQREYRAGLAEVIKYGLIGDAAFFDWLQAKLDALLDLEQATLTEAVLRSCRNKADIVGQDEREKGVRALLNFGHSFGHAIEAATNYTEFLHGEAVAIGMVIASRLSADLGDISNAQQNAIKALLQRAGLAIELPPPLEPEQLLQLMRLDKKNRQQRLHLVLLEDIGHAVLRSDLEPAQIAAAIDACR